MLDKGMTKYGKCIHYVHVAVNNTKHRNMVLTLSIKVCSSCGDSISDATTNPMTKNNVYMNRVPVDSLICGRHRQHRPQDAGPSQHFNCKEVEQTKSAE